MPRSSPSESKRRSDEHQPVADDNSMMGRTPSARKEPPTEPPPPPHHDGVARGRPSSPGSSPINESLIDPKEQHPSSPTASNATDDAIGSISPQPSGARLGDVTTTATSATAGGASATRSRRKRPSDEKQGSRSKKQNRVSLQPLQVSSYPCMGEIVLNHRKSLQKSNQTADNNAANRNSATISIPAVTPTPTRLGELGAHAFDSESKENQTSPSSSSSSSTSTSGKSLLSATHDPVPEGVTQLYPPRRAIPRLSCRCSEHCSSDSLTFNYILSYGRDHGRLLRRSENFSSSTSLQLHRRHSSDSSIANHSHASEAAGNSNSSVATPPSGLDWLNVNQQQRRLAMNHHDGDDNSTSATAPVVESDNYMARQPDLTPQMRAILVDWLIELSEEYNLTPASLHLAITLVDKSLATGPQTTEDDDDDNQLEGTMAGLEVTRDMLQCVGCACLWIACKFEEIEPPSVDDFVYISDNSYTRQQIKDMEMSVCAALRFHVWQVTPFHYVYEFLRASHACSNPECLPTNHHHMFHYMVLYLLEIARVPYELASSPPSLIAAAAVYLARATLGMRDVVATTAASKNKAEDATAQHSGFWTHTLSHYTGYTVDQLKDTVRVIHRRHRRTGVGSLKQVFLKYAKDKHYKVSLKAAINEEDLGF